MMIYRERGVALLFGMHLTPWMYVAQVRVRWIVVYVGPWRCEWEFVKQLTGVP